MPSNAEANIILRLKDEFSKGLQAAGQNFASFGRQVDQLGTAMSRTGAKMVAIGTTINAPFFAAAKVMENYSFAAQNQMTRLNNEFLSLSKVVSEAAMPTIKAFNDTFSKVVNTLKTVDPVLLQNIANWSMTSGMILIVVGTLELFAGKVISLFGKMLKPINLVMLAIAALVYAWVNYHDEFMKVLNAIDIAFNRFVIFMLEGIKKIMEGLVTLSRFFPPMAGMTAPIQAGLDSLNRVISAFKQNVVQAQAGNGAFAQSVNTMGAGLQGFITKMKNAYKSASSDLETVMKDASIRIRDLGYSMADGFGDAFSQMLFEGKSFADSLKNLFKKMAQDIVKDFVSTVGRNLIGGIMGQAGTQSGSGIGGLLGAGIGSFFGPIGGMLGGLFGKFFHDGGPIYAHSGLAPDEVPIIAQSGEGVISRRGMKALGGSDNLRKLNSGGSVGGGGQTIVINQVIQAWDASDIYRNRKALSQAIADDIKNNGSMRQTMNSYR